MEIESTELFASLLAVSLLFSIILILKIISLSRSVRKHLETIESNHNFVRCKLAQIDFDVKDFRRTYQYQTIKDRKSELAKSTGLYPSKEGSFSKIQPFQQGPFQASALETQENNLGNVP